MSSLIRPAGLVEEHWLAISSADARLTRALDDADFMLVVGSSKELCESVAKSVLVTKGLELRNSESIESLLARAHAALDRQPGAGLATEEPIRSMAQNTKKIVLSVAGLRRTHGTGHGYAELPPVTEEHAMLAGDAARLWSRWALKRLSEMLANGVDRLISDLTSSTFSRGALKVRLSSVGVADLPSDDARRLGRAVAHRGGVGGTFTVLEDGVEDACSDPASWPTPYTEGVLEGLFIDRNGYVNTEPRLIEMAAHLAAKGTGPGLVADLASTLTGSDFAYNFDLGAVNAVHEAIRTTAALISDPERRGQWLELAERFGAGSSFDRALSG